VFHNKVAKIPNNIELHKTTKRIEK